jgi:hypothetical protein
VQQQTRKRVRRHQNKKMFVAWSNSSDDMKPKMFLAITLILLLLRTRMESESAIAKDFTTMTSVTIMTDVVTSVTNVTDVVTSVTNVTKMSYLWNTNIQNEVRGM